MEDNEFTSIKDFLEMCEREGVRKESDLTRSEIVELAQLALAEIEGERDRQIQLIRSVFRTHPTAVEEMLEAHEEFNRLREANRHHEAAVDVLEGAVRGAYNDPAMTPEVKKIAKVFLILLERRRPLFNYELETIFRPVIEEAGEEAKKEIKTEFGRTGGKSSKKPAQKSRALTCWNEWAGADSPRKKHRNKTAFVNHLVEQGLCNAKTGGEWVVEFREDYPSPALEDILKKTKNR